MRGVGRRREVDEDEDEEGHYSVSSDIVPPGTLQFWISFVATCSLLPLWNPESVSVSALPFFFCPEFTWDRIRVWWFFGSPGGGANIGLRLGGTM